MPDETALAEAAERRMTARDALPLVVLFAITIIAKLPTLDTPAYWDEMGWLRQADWLEKQGLLAFFPGLRPAAAFWGHPPGLHLMLALVGRLFGVSVTSAHALIAVIAALGVCGTYLLARRFYDSTTAWLAALTLLLSSMYFGQSGMFLADVPVAALGALAMYFALSERYWPYVISATAMVFIKETAIAPVVALLLYRFAVVSPLGRLRSRELIKYSVPLIAIAAFILLQKLTTGKFFFIYDFEFQGLVELTPHTVRRRFEMITEWIFVKQHRWIFTLLILLNLAVTARARRRRELWLFAFVLVMSGYSFSVLFFLPRYLLPVLPLFYIAGAAAFVDLMRQRRLRLAGAAALVALSVWSLLREPFWGNGETSLRYLDVVAMNDAAADRLESEFPAARVLTTWPHTTALSSSLQGYVSRPIQTVEHKFAGDTASADVIFVSQPAEGTEDPLIRIARSADWRLLQRWEGAGAWTELYVPASPPAP